jgi:hypothetical protein
MSVRLVVLLCLSSALGFAANWSGSLVDSRCYANEERNINPTETLQYVDRDTNYELRYCAPSAQTKSFTFVDHQGTSFQLDSAGITKAADLVRKTGKKAPFAVNVTGELNKNAIGVETISLAK